jgi:hypothetical protein
MSSSRRSRPTDLVAESGRRVPLTVTGVTPALRNPLVPVAQKRRAGAHGRSKGGVRAMRKRELAETLWHDVD